MVKKRIVRFIGIFLLAMMVLVLVPPTQVHAAATTEDNPIIFKVIGGVSALGEVEYNIVVDDVYAGDGMTYQSFTIVYPSELEIHFQQPYFANSLSPTWNLFENTDSNPKSINAIIKRSNRAPLTLLQDLNSIYFTLVDPDVFPSDGSTVTITATKEKVAFFQDAGGYVHYYQFVPFSLNAAGDPVMGQNPATSASKTWWEAYNIAKNSTIQDPRYPDDPTKVLKGYLATITSEDEQKQLYSAIADWSGWLGGTRMVFTNGLTRIQDDNVITGNTGTHPAQNTWGDYSFGPSQTQWYWACGPEAWTVFNPATQKYTYYPEGWTTVYEDSWVIHNTVSEVDTYLCRSAIEPEVPNLGENETVIEDPNRGKAVGPLTFYNNHVFVAATRYNIPGVYSNWNNPNEGTLHYYDANKTFAGTEAGKGGEPNGGGTPPEYCLQFAYPSGTFTLTADKSLTGADVSTGKPDTWNDYYGVNTNNLYGYFIEYGGYPGDPKAEDLVGSGVSTTSEVSLVMPIIIQYRSTVLTEDGRYARITGIEALLDRVTTYEASIPYTAIRNYDPRAVSIPGYTPYGYAFYGEPEDEARLTLKANGDVDGFHSNFTQRIQFLYKPDPYTLTFDANFTGWSSADVSPGSKTILYDTPYGDLAAAIRPGYTLDGWYLSDDCSGDELDPDERVAGEGDRTVYAGWTEKSDFTVYYDLDGGEDTGGFDPLTGVAWTEDGLLPADPPERTGYIFTGWNVSLNGSKQNVRATDTYGSLAENEAETSITLEAQWMKEDMIMIFYHLNGAETPHLSELPDGVLELASHPVEFPLATRTGYTFGGWKVTNNGLGVEGTVPYPAETTGVVYGDLAGSTGEGYAQFVILEAQWAAKTYKVNYDINNGSGTTSYGTPRTGVLWTQNGLVPPAEGNPSWTNHIFMGWNTEPDGEGEEAYVGSAYAQLAGSETVGEITLYAQWMAEKTYYVCYETNGGTPAVIADKTGVYTYSNNLLPADPAPPTGYDFTGWSVVYNGNKAGVTSTDTFGNLAGDPNLGFIILRAQYSPKGGLTMNYDLNGHPQAGYPAKRPANPPADPYIVWTQSNLLPPIDPASTGYTFLGWNTKADGTGIAATTADTFGVLASGNDTLAQITLYAQWQEITANTYTVMYNTAGGTPIANAILSNVTDPVNLAAPATPPTGYLFDYWIVEDNGYGMGTGRVDDGALYEDLAYGSGAGIKLFIKLKAVYVERSDYQVVYDLNYSGGGTVHTETGVSWTQSGFVPYAANRPGFTLTGWKATVSGADINVLENTQYRALAGGVDSTASVTLKAQWEEANFYVRYDLNGISVPADSGTAFDHRTVGYDETGLIPGYALKRVGYTLSGWNVSENGSKPNVTAADSFRTLANTGAAYITLQAQWRPKDYVVYYDTNGGLSISSQSVSWWADKLLPATPVKYGYTFVGWTLSKIENDVQPPSSYHISDQDKYSDLAAVNGYDSGNITLQAQWAAKSYSVIYDMNDGSAGTVDPASVATKTGVEWNDTGLLPAGVSPVRTDGNKFLGWAVSKIGAGDVTPGALVTATNAYGSLAGNANDGAVSITLQAQWKPSDGYSVLYDLNGGTASAQIRDLVNSVDGIDTGFVPSGVTITKPGYTFSGDWALVRRGGVEVSPPGAVTQASSYLILSSGAMTITLSPVYTENAGVSITFGTKTLGASGEAQADGLGGSVTKSGTLTYPPVTGDPTSTATANAGYAFSGWYAAGDTSFTNRLGSAAAFTPQRDSNGLNVDGGSYVALFRENAGVRITFGTITLGSDGTAQADGLGGSVTPNGTVYYPPATGSPASTATANAGYTFAGWYEERDTTFRTLIESSATLTPAKTGGLNVTGGYVALFREGADVNISFAAKTFSLSWAPQTDTLGGSVRTNGSGSYAPATGSPVATAAPIDGFSLVGWYRDGAAYETTTPLGTGVSFTPAKTGGVYTADNYVAVFMESSVTIRYLATSGGTVSAASENVAPISGSPAGAAAAQKEGYTFAGWYYGGLKVSDDAAFIPERDTDGLYKSRIYTAMFIENNRPDDGYKVEHYLVDASGTPTLHETEDFFGIIGKSVTALQKTGYTGYTYAAGYTGEVKTGTVAAGGGLVLKLYYRVSTYNIRYAITGAVPAGAPAAPAIENNVPYGTSKTVDTLTVGNGTDYTFSGWRTTDCKVTSGSFDMPDRDVTFTGSWIDHTATTVAGYRVEHYLVNVNGIMSLAEAEALTGTIGTTVTATEKKYSGYNYEAGYRGEEKSGAILPDGSLVLKVYYPAYRHSITYVINGYEPEGAPAPPAAVTNAVCGESRTVVNLAPITGYTFSGWTTIQCKLDGNGFVMPDMNVVLTGSWIPSGDIAGGDTYAEYNVEHYLVDAANIATLYETEKCYGIAGNTTAAREKTGYTGYRFYDGYTGEVRAGTILSDGSLLLKLYYTVIPRSIDYRVTGTIPTGAPDPPAAVSNALYGETRTVFNMGTVAGYTFSGWTTADCKVEGGGFTMPNSNVIFLGSWIPDEKQAAGNYIIRHHLRMRDGSIVDEEVETLKGAVGGTVTAEPKNYTGFTYDHPNSSVVLTSAPVPARVGFIPYDAEYALWTPNAGDPQVNAYKAAEYTGDVKTGVVTTGTLTFDLYYTPSVNEIVYEVFGDVPAGAPAPPPGTAAYGDSIPVNTGLFYAGYTFSLWRSSDVRMVSGAFTMPDSKVTFYGTWTLNPPPQAQVIPIIPVTPAPAPGGGSSGQGQPQEEPPDWGFLSDEDPEEELVEDELTQDELLLDDTTQGGGGGDGHDQTGYGTTTTSMAYNQDMTPDEVLSALKDEGVPIFNIGKNETPLFSKPGLPAWSQLNMILAFIGVTLAVSALFSSMRKKDRGFRASEKTMKMLRWMVVIGAAGIVIFMLTQDTRNLIVLFDGWTVVHAVAFAAEIMILKKMMNPPAEVKNPYNFGIPWAG